MCFRVLRSQLLDQTSAFNGDLLDLFLAHIEDDLAESRCAGVVQVNHGAFGARAGFYRLADQVFTRLSQCNDGDVIGNAIFVHQFTYEVEVGL